MSDEDSLSELNVAPQRLMPKAPTLTEHHRILNLSAIHHGNTLATIKAHKVRADSFDERLEEFEKLREEFSELRDELVTHRQMLRDSASQQERAMASQGALIGQLALKQTEMSGGIDMKKAIITGFFGLLIAIVTAGGGYMMGHTSPRPKYEAPTHAQQMVIDQKYNDMQPENQRQMPER